MIQKMSHTTIYVLDQDLAKMGFEVKLDQLLLRFSLTQPKNYSSCLSGRNAGPLRFGLLTIVGDFLRLQGEAEHPMW